MMRDRRRAFTPTEVAGQLGVNPESVRVWIRRGWLRAIKLGHSTIRITPADLNAFLAAHRVGMGRPREKGSRRERKAEKDRGDSLDGRANP